MSNAKQETIDDIVADIRAQNQGLPEDSYALSPLVCDLLSLADRIEAAEKRMVESIHRAMVIIAGIEMENSDYPHRLWTALEDAYDALSDALGTDGETTADEEEAKAIGRHFVVKSYGNAAKMREALENIVLTTIKAGKSISCDVACGIISSTAKAALSAPPRNCDVGTVEEQYARVRAFCKRHKVGLRCVDCPVNGVFPKNCALIWSQMPYEEGGAE